MLCGPACSVPWIRASTWGGGRGARACVCWEGGGPILRGGEPGEETGISRPAPPFTLPRRSSCTSNTCRVQSGRQPCGSSARAFWTGPLGVARRRCSSLDGGLVRAVCSAWRSSQCGSRLPRPPLLHVAACVCVRPPGWRVERRRALQMRVLLRAPSPRPPRRAGRIPADGVPTRGLGQRCLAPPNFPRLLDPAGRVGVACLGCNVILEPAHPGQRRSTRSSTAQ